MNGERYVITIDGGTTNTRCILWDKNRMKAAERSMEFGARNAAMANENKTLKERVKTCLEELLTEAGVDWPEVKCVMAGGMLTSEAGLAAVPHIEAPAGLEELAKGLVTLRLEDVCPIPIRLIPGVKNKAKTGEWDAHESMDMMRGEETECLPMIEAFGGSAPLLLILPGSHNKFIAVDENGKITGCVTTVSGELLDSITKHTILAKSVDSRFLSVKDYDLEWVLSGYRNARQTGLGRALFSARILSLDQGGRPEKIQNYILGAVLEGDVRALLNTKAIGTAGGRSVVVWGKDPLKQALADILREENIFPVIHTFDPKGSLPPSALGAFLIAEKAGLL